MKMIKSTLYLGTAALMIMSFTPQAFAGHHSNNSRMQEHHKMAPENMGVMGKGVLNEVMAADRKVNITHEAIPALKWPTMTMDLPVTDGVNLDGLAKDQRVKFHITLGADKVYRITQIMTLEIGQQCKAGMDCPMHGGMMNDGMMHNGMMNDDDDANGKHQH